MPFDHVADSCRRLRWLNVAIEYGGWVRRNVVCYAKTDAR
ncbi:hypothetical protein BIFADO_00452 [Bifidobacterium adolescentis L2-32]|uniref:Uncharacterized protein n=1 Tax=Bifidobacterium adolescentis L2-32 TaxID=411481 RepID=A7A3R0_BIFAD|nr:hypothetical protein BIFADO_00452 [Bifidobacterium adolescentis L2-32]